LIPADLHADFSVLRLKIRETEIARSEIILFVVQRIVGNVHFAVFAEEPAVGVDHRASVVINAGGAALKKGNDQSDFALLGDLCKFVGGGAWNRLGKIEQRGILLAAKIFAPEKFVERDDLRAASRRFTYFVHRAREIF